MKSTLAVHDDCTTVELKGRLTEEAEAELLELRGRLKTPRIEFDVAGLTHLNSYGATRWMRFVHDLAQRASLTFRNCPAHFIEYLNMLPSFVGGGRVLSLSLPYYCDACDAVTEVLLETKALNASQGFPPTPCSRCSAPAHPDVDMERFLDFLS